MPLRYNSNGSLRDFTPEEVQAMMISTADVRDGGHPVHRRDGRSCTIMRPYFCKWDLYDDFIAFMLGGSTTYSASGNMALSRVMPQTYPTYPQFAAVGIEDLRGSQGVGKDDPTGIPKYPMAKAMVRFEWVPFGLASDTDIDGDETIRYVERLPAKTEVNYLQLPGSSLRYIRKDGTIVPGPGLAGTPSPHLNVIPRGVGFPESQQTIGFKFHRVPFDAWGAPSCPLYNRVFGDIQAGILPYIGTVNKASLFGFDPGLAFFVGVEEELVPDPVTSQLTWDLTFNWILRTMDHNFLYWTDSIANPASNPGYYFCGRADPTTGLYKYYTADVLPDGIALFNSRNHVDLFNIGIVTP